jgi:adenosylcobinamide-GDP ribazoletransferase
LSAPFPSLDPALLRDVPQALATDLARCIRFYSRIPVPRLPWETDPHGVPDFRTMPRMLPVAGALFGAIGGLVLWLSAGLGPFLAAALALTVLTLATGAFHEDGLADTADGFGGGRDAAHRLIIMKDSRIGTFGGAALIMAYTLRIGALAALIERTGAGAAAFAMIGAGGLSRTAALPLLAYLPPVRPEGASAVVGQPNERTLSLSLALAVAIGFIAMLMGGLPVSGFFFGLCGTALTAGAAIGISHRLIGGQTGDVAGAVQQVGEIAFLLALVAAA